MFVGFSRGGERGRTERETGAEHERTSQKMPARMGWQVNRHESVVSVRGGGDKDFYGKHRTPNIEHRTSNIQRATFAPVRHWMFGVGCSMFDVLIGPSL